MILTDPNTFIDSLLNPNHRPRLDLVPNGYGLSKRTISAVLTPLKTTLTPRRYCALLALILLWNDAWENAHECVQAEEGDPDCDLVHAYIHRKEEDFSNAKWWLQRVGYHPNFAEISLALVEAQKNNPAMNLKFPYQEKYDPLYWLTEIKSKRIPETCEWVQAIEWRALAHSWIK